MGVTLAIFSSRIAKLMNSLGLKWSIENPRSSRLWDFHPIKSLFSLHGVQFVSWDMCEYEVAHKKPTGLLTNIPSLAILARKCSGQHAHSQLRGTERVQVEGRTVTRNKTAGAGAYPFALARTWAEAVAGQAPANAQGSAQERDLDYFEEKLQTAAQTQTRRHGRHRQPGDAKHDDTTEPSTSRSRPGSKPHASTKQEARCFKETGNGKDRETRHGQEASCGTQPDCASHPAADRGHSSDRLDPALAGAAACIRAGIIFGQHSNHEADAIRRQWARAGSTSCPADQPAR